ncbi:hypothetical protein [Candidatus Xianfuyuplasma coldseepsis]|uniref:Signal peptidase I n=1 Tax=Candidatus Xianfuyuplasma coldseepsis TaxID=2782163 RepID=A0A7L7KPM8_9MOLU|nr:hypothetical protein [Xianfuyuplasma coldseepsis]QMS84627.1 hypothetical protein G4Z02_02300 [Xianfuyuplasma coldseepsis]
MKLVMKLISYGVSAALILYIGITLLAPQLTMDIFGFRSFIVVSPSMVPDINVYDMIFITDVEESDLEIDDIITFSVYIPEVDQVSFVTHYIGDIQTQTGDDTIYKTHGANFEEGDSFDDWEDKDGNPIDITFDDIEGEYQFKIPYVGYLVTMLRDPIFLGLLAINGTIIYFLVKTVKKTFLNKDNEKKESE